MNSKEDTWNKLFKDLDSDEMLEIASKEEEKPIELKELFLDYFQDYCKISYLEDIKENEVYLINKWKCIYFHCVELDDYFYFLEDKNNTSLSLKNKKSNDGKKSNSLSSINNTQLSSDKSSSIKSENNLSIVDNIVPHNLSEISSSFSSQSKEENDTNTINNINEINIIKKFDDKNVYEFKLVEAKKSLQIYENEKITGVEYELKCRRIFNLMLLFVQRDNYKIYNPHKIPLQNIINYLKIKEFDNMKLTESDSFEIDLVINNFKISDFNKLLKSYSSHFFFIDNLGLKSLKENENINLIGEISRNFLIQIDNKSAQHRTYLATFKIFEALSINNTNISEEEKNSIFSYFHLTNNNNKNCFIIITDGSYFILRFTIDIISKVKKQKLEDKKILPYIKDEINKNKEILKYLMSNKFRNLDNLIFKTFKAIKYLEDNHIRFCLLFIGDKGSNRLENFYKEKEGRNMEIVLETKFKSKMKYLINKLIESKDRISYEIREFGTKIKSFLYNKKIIIRSKNKIKSLPDYFKINVKFYYADEKISILKKNKFIIISKLLNEETFLRTFNKYLKIQNSDSLLVFIDNKNILSNNNQINNKYIIVVKETEFSQIYENIETIIRKNSDYFNDMVKQKVDVKKKELKKNKNVYSVKSKLTSEIVIKKLKDDIELCIDVENLFKYLELYCDEKIENIDIYIKELIENKNEFEKLIKKEYLNDFKNLISNNFALLLECIKSSIIYDYIVDELIWEMVLSSWADMYIVY